jgi:hypothetical protein
MALSKRDKIRKANLLKKHNLEGANKSKRTPSHPTKSHIVLAQEGSQLKLIRFGEQGASTAGKPKSGESDRMKKKRKSFKSRHQKNIAKGKMSAAYWADKAKW